MRRVGFVILGSNGYIANDCAFQCLPRVKESLRQEGIELTLAEVADPAYFRFQAPSLIEDASAKLWANMAKLNACPIIPDGNQAITLVTSDVNKTGLANHDAIIVYDGSPTVRHAAHFTEVRKGEAASIFYFGEKPIFLDPVFLNELKQRPDDHPLYCDFIETQNPAVNKIQEEIVARNLQITKMAFWRTGASGIKHIVGHTQSGVQGGALLDKGPHDLSISAMLLGPRNIVRTVVKPDAEFLSFVPKYSPMGSLTFLDASNRWNEEPRFDFRSDNGDRLSLVADGLSHFEIDWHLENGSTIPTEFLFGWLGYSGKFNPINAHAYEKRFVSALDRLKIPETEWLLVEEDIGTTGQRFIETQARIGIVDVVSPTGACSQFVANFIASKERQGRPQIRRWARYVDSNGDVSPVFDGPDADYHVQKVNDLAEVFCKVVRDALGEEEAIFLNSRPTLTVHEALLGARDLALINADKRHKAGGFDHAQTVAFIKQCFLA